MRLSAAGRVRMAMTSRSGLLALTLLGACFAMPQPTPMVAQSPAVTQAQARHSAAMSMGEPTKKSPADLEAMIAQQTKEFHKTGRRGEGRLEAPAAFAIEGVKGTCYTIVMRLGDGAAWGVGAEAGLKFDFRAPTGPGSGGPGVAGPGAVASVGCAEADGTITLAMAPLIGADPIGSGPYSLEVWSHTLTRAEAAHLEADKQRQIEEQREFAAREAQKKHDRESTGCARCEARYQGCIGAGRSDCRDQYSSCAFEEAGADYLSACPSP